jgi:dolichol kinase
MFAGGFLLSLAIVSIFVTAGVFSAGLIRFVVPILIISLAGTLVESLPLRDLDNLTVPATAVLLGFVLFS